MSKPKTILVVDADTIAYAAAAVCEDRSVEVTHLKSNRKKIVKNRTEFKDFLAAKDYPYIKEDYNFEDKQENPDIAKLQKILKGKLNSMEDMWMPDKMEIFVSGSGNFRNDLPLPSRYKSNRDTAVRPILLKTAKEYLIKLGAIPTHGEEPDDAIVYKAYAYMNKGHDVIVGSYEKDSRAYTGLRLWDYTQETNETYVVPDFGELRYKDGKTEGEGFIWYAYQHIRGDRSDGYLPYEAAKARFGDKAAYDQLKDCKTKQSVLAAVIQQFQTWYPTEFSYVDWSGTGRMVDYKFMLDLYFKACRMKSSKDDKLNFEEFCNINGVQL